MTNSVNPQMALLRDFSVGRRDLNPQNSTLFLRFKSDARLELTQNPSFVDKNESKKDQPYGYVKIETLDHLQNGVNK